MTDRPASGIGRATETPIAGWQSPNVLTPDDVMAGCEIVSPVIVYDDDHYYMGSVPRLSSLPCLPTSSRARLRSVTSAGTIAGVTLAGTSVRIFTGG